MPGEITVRGHKLPVLALAGGAGTGIAWVVVTALNFSTLIAGAVWLSVGIATYVVYAATRAVAHADDEDRGPEAVVEREVEYQSCSSRSRTTSTRRAVATP